MATLPLMIGGAAISGIGNFYAGRKMAGAYKTAGTTLANAANNEAATALTIPGMVNPLLASAYGQAQQSVTSAADTAGGIIEDRANQARAEAMGAGREAAGYQNPYMEAGTRSLATLSDLVNAPAATFDPTQVTMDPSFAFRMAQGTQALQKSAAARGGLMGGGTMKALTNYSQGLASTEYANAYDRALRTFQANQGARQTQLANLTNLVNTGSTAATRAGEDIVGTTEYGGTTALQGATTSGQLRTQAARESADYGVQGETAQVQNILQAQDIARQARLGAAQATAESQMGAAGAGAQAFSGLTGAIGGGMTLAGMAGAKLPGFGSLPSPMTAARTLPYGNAAARNLALTLPPISYGGGDYVSGMGF